MAHMPSLPLPEDGTNVSAALSAAQDAAACLLLGSHNGPSCGCAAAGVEESKMPFTYPDYKRFVSRANQDPTIASAKIRFEFDFFEATYADVDPVVPPANAPLLATIRFKMSQGPIHAYLVDNIGRLIFEKARAVFQDQLTTDLESLGQIGINLGPPPIRHPDGAWGGDAGGPLVARAVLEVAHSSPVSIEALEAKLKDFIVLSGGQVRLAVGVKIPYDPHSTKQAFENAVPRCVVAA
ncbi:hypothetical protein ColLi_13121 [Colletotrichum liriopes]|uniref:Uncharacterized protein n=1 Tax=Colletotrichum liriopes TaxID=708192 RepID=A0AA37M0B5_9PEZI|nr:hypothetical protein ColLi_13121 [Colletotrichum liriopes]